MKFSAILFAAAAATLAVAHPSVEAIHDVQVRDTNTHLTHFDMHKRKRIVHKDVKVTFYWGNQLNNPACGGPTPNENEPVAAVKLSMGWVKCGDTLQDGERTPSTS
ncbi:hypothetical protein OC846_006342 [Tilletia horrida]|uniref:Uncharacterized protein n=1 Tax=Tilletia horrida TaxID=155126 RepID=A0AAN6JP27_9BASI|nr:hypothetical protein OC846_006342 [Tilletia horrida]KAK0548796.1 hypothetical protein OC845_003415 [Tilletia horrida]KAK0562819.1 hypothetical protein OC861_005131 [Tilletia horrida]